MILPWHTGPPMCGQTFSKAVNLPSRQNTPTSTPSISTTLRPGSGNAAASPITTSLMRTSLPGSSGAAVPQRQVEQVEIGCPQHLADEHDDLGRRDPVGGN